MVWWDDSFPSPTLVWSAREHRFPESIASQKDVPHDPDASTLRVTAFNVGMIQKEASIRTQEKKIAELASYVNKWLEDGYAAVGLNEIHRNLAEMLQAKLMDIGIMDIDIAINDTDCLLWRIPL